MGTFCSPGFTSRHSEQSTIESEYICGNRRLIDCELVEQRALARQGSMCSNCIPKEFDSRRVRIRVRVIQGDHESLARFAIRRKSASLGIKRDASS